MNTTWKTLTADAFPKTTKEMHITYENENKTAYRSNDVYVIAIDREHVHDACLYIWEPAICIDDGKYIISVFYAKHTVWTDPETGEIVDEEKRFYSTDNMCIVIDHPDMKYCKYQKLKIMNPEWEQKPLTADTFPKNAEEVYSTYENDKGDIVYRSNDACVIAIERDHMYKVRRSNWKPTALDYDSHSQYIFRVFYAEYTVHTDPDTGKSKDIEKTFYSTDGMSISIDDENIKYCKYHRLETENL